MLSMGNGDHSAATVFDRLRRLMKLYETMGGLQQTGGPLSNGKELDWNEFDQDRSRFLRDIKSDFTSDEEEKQEELFAKTDEKTCENCGNWDSGFEFNIEKEKTHPCRREGTDTRNMEDNQFAIICGHDGPIYCGKDFGCKFWEEK